MPILQGKIRWTKVLGAPPTGYVKPGMKPREVDKAWSFELLVDGNNAADIKRLGLFDRVKVDKNGVQFIKFKRKAYKNDDVNTPNNPIEVVDGKQQPWPDSKLIGNDSVVNIMLDILGNDYPYVKKIQVWKHVPYKEEEQFPTKVDDELDDPIPDFTDNKPIGDEGKKNDRTRKAKIPSTGDTWD